MVLRVTNLNTWIHKDFMRDFYYKGIESLSKVYLKLVKQTTVEIIIKPLTPTILLNIQSSSAFVERFFSICGIICKKRASNMKNKLIIMRSMMKANFHLLNEFNEQC